MAEIQNRPPDGLSGPSFSPAPRSGGSGGGGGKGWFYGALVLFVLLLISGMLNLGLGARLAARKGGEASLSGYEATLVDGEASQDDFVAIVPIQGLIMEQPDAEGPGKGSVTNLTKLLKALKKKDNLKGIVLLIDSPGGGVTASDRMYHELVRFKQEKKVPIVALFEDVAASGGYYVAMSADHIMAHSTTVTGSIGVISQFYNASELMGKVGLKVNTVKSLNDLGKESFKDMGSPYRPMREDERKLIQSLITEMWERFVSVVAEGRKGHMQVADVKKIADGRIVSASQALKLKLIDSIGYSEDAYKKVRELAKSPEARIVRYSKRSAWTELFSASAKVAPPDLKSLLNIQTCPFLYLWEGGQP